MRERTVPDSQFGLHALSIFLRLSSFYPFFGLLLYHKPTPLRTCQDPFGIPRLLGLERLGGTPRPTTTRVIFCFTIQGHQAHSGETARIIPNSAAKCKRKSKLSLRHLPMLPYDGHWLSCIYIRFYARACARVPQRKRHPSPRQVVILAVV